MPRESKETCPRILSWLLESKITLIAQYKCTMHTMWKCSSVPISWLNIRRDCLGQAKGQQLLFGGQGAPTFPTASALIQVSPSALHKTARIFVYLKLLALC